MGGCRGAGMGLAHRGWHGLGGGLALGPGRGVGMAGWAGRRADMGTAYGLGGGLAWRLAITCL